MAMRDGSIAISHPVSSTRAFVAIRVNCDIPCCSSSFNAPLCRSAATRRIATKGSRKTAASSHALKAGAQTPISGDSASPTPAAVPFSPLTSAYVRTALMKETPTSGPMARSSTHQDFEEASARHSFSRSHGIGGLRERKEDLFQAAGSSGDIPRRGQCGEFLDRAFTADAAAAEEYEAVAETRRIADLVNR